MEAVDEETAVGDEAPDKPGAKSEGGTTTKKDGEESKKDDEEMVEDGEEDPGDDRPDTESEEEVVEV